MMHLPDDEMQSVLCGAQLWQGQFYTALQEGKYCNGSAQDVRNVFGHLMLWLGHMSRHTTTSLLRPTVALKGATFSHPGQQQQSISTCTL